MADHRGRRVRWVTAVTYASGFEADVAVASLEAAGVPARARPNDIVGIFGPGFSGATARGVDVLVPEPALAEARRVLATDRSAAAGYDPAGDADDGPAGERP